MYSNDSSQISSHTPKRSPNSNLPSPRFLVPDGPLFHQNKVRCCSTPTTMMEKDWSGTAYASRDNCNNSSKDHGNNSRQAGLGEPLSYSSPNGGIKNANYIPLGSGSNSSRQCSPLQGRLSWTPEYSHFSPLGRGHANSSWRRRGGGNRRHYPKRHPRMLDDGHTPDIRSYISPRFLEDPWAHLVKTKEEK